MQYKTLFSAGVITAVAVAIAPPISAQPIPPVASNACLQRTAEAMVVPVRELQITDAGRIDASTGVRTLFIRNTVTGQTAECTVNTIDGYVLSVRLTSQPPRPPQPPTQPPQTVPQASINACIQRTAEEMVVRSAEIQMSSAGPANGLGERTLFMRNTVTGQTAECRVNTTTNTVLSVRLTSQPTQPPTTPGRPVSPNDPSVRACQSTVANRIKRDFAGVQQVTFSTNTTQKFFISNAVNGIRGMGQFIQRGTGFNFDYNCQINIRNGVVKQATYRVLR